MQIQPISYSVRQQKFLAECLGIGVVLDVCAFEIPDAENVFEISKVAAVEAMKAFSKKRSTQYWQIVIDERIAPAGWKISAKEFLGGGFDFKNRRVEMFRYNTSSRSNLHTDGFLRALLDPPYRVRLPLETEAAPFSKEYGICEQAKMTEFLFEFLERILGVREAAELSKFDIYGWSDDWSNYFDAGKEWWGTFYWTLLDRQNRRITVFGASTTD